MLYVNESEKERPPFYLARYGEISTPDHTATSWIGAYLLHAQLVFAIVYVGPRGVVLPDLDIPAQGESQGYKEGWLITFRRCPCGCPFTPAPLWRLSVGDAFARRPSRLLTGARIRSRRVY